MFYFLSELKYIYQSKPFSVTEKKWVISLAKVGVGDKEQW